jgi:hypothetical protein
MKLRSRINAILGGLILTAGLGVATAIPASAITTRIDISYEGDGSFLAVCGRVASGDNVGFVANADCMSTDNEWDYQLEGGSGTAKYYYVHPNGYDSLCMTASTTQFGVIKIENCVSADQQYWFNPNNSQSYYHLYSDYWGAYLYDPGDYNIGLSFSCSYGDNSCTFAEP